MILGVPSNLSLCDSVNNVLYASQRDTSKTRCSSPFGNFLSPCLNTVEVGLFLSNNRTLMCFHDKITCRCYWVPCNSISKGSGISVIYNIAAEKMGVIPSVNQFHSKLLTACLESCVHEDFTTKDH